MKVPVSHAHPQVTNQYLAWVLDQWQHDMYFYATPPGPTQVNCGPIVMRMISNETVNPFHTVDMDFEVIEFSLFTFWWAHTDVTSCLKFVRYSISTCILLFKYASFDTDMDLGWVINIEHNTCISLCQAPGQIFNSDWK